MADIKLTDRGYSVDGGTPIPVDKAPPILVSAYQAQQGSIQDPGGQLLPPPPTEAAPQPKAPGYVPDPNLVQPVSPSEVAQAASASQPPPSSPPQTAVEGVPPLLARPEESQPSTEQAPQPNASAPTTGSGGVSIGTGPIQKLINNNVDLVNAPIRKSINGVDTLVYASGKQVPWDKASNEEKQQYLAGPDQVNLQKQKAIDLKDEAAKLKQETDAASGMAKNTWQLDLEKNRTEQLAEKQNDAEKTMKDMEKNSWDRIAKDESGKTTVGGVLEYVGRTILPFVDSPNRIQNEAMAKDAAHLRTLQTQIQDIESQYKDAGRIGELDNAVTYFNDYQTAAKKLQEATTVDEKQKALEEMNKAKQSIAGVNSTTANDALRVIGTKLQGYQLGLQARQMEFEKQKFSATQGKMPEETQKQLASLNAMSTSIATLAKIAPDVSSVVTAHSPFYNQDQGWFNQLNLLKPQLIYALTGSTRAESSPQILHMVEQVWPKPSDSQATKQDKLMKIRQIILDRARSTINMAANPTATGATINFLRSSRQQ